MFAAALAPLFFPFYGVILLNRPALTIFWFGIYLGLVVLLFIMSAKASARAFYRSRRNSRIPLGLIGCTGLVLSLAIFYHLGGIEGGVGRLEARSNNRLAALVYGAMSIGTLIIACLLFIKKRGMYSFFLVVTASFYFLSNVGRGGILQIFFIYFGTAFLHRRELQRSIGFIGYAAMLSVCSLAIAIIVHEYKINLIDFANLIATRMALSADIFLFEQYFSSVVVPYSEVFYPLHSILKNFIDINYNTIGTLLKDLSDGSSGSTSGPTPLYPVIVYEIFGWGHLFSFFYFISLAIILYLTSWILASILGLRQILPIYQMYSTLYLLSYLFFDLGSLVIVMLHIICLGCFLAAIFRFRFRFR